MKPSNLARYGICLALVLGTAPALAGDAEQAQALFDKGLAAMEAQRYDEGCPAIEASYKLDPLAGALFTLAECERMRGRLARAAARYDEYLALHGKLSPDKKAKQRDRDKKAREQRAALSGKIAELTLVLPGSAPKGTAVMRNGVAVPAWALGVPVPVDPGEYVIVARTPSGGVTETRVTLAAGEKKGIPVEVRVVKVAVAAAGGRPSGVKAHVERGPKGGILTAGGAAGGFGVVIGAVLLGVSASEASSVSKLYDEAKAAGNCQSDTGGKCKELRDAGKAKATLGNTGLWMLVGGGVVGVATLVYGLTAGSSKGSEKSGVRVVPLVTGDGGGVSVGGAF